MRDEGGTKNGWEWKCHYYHPPLHPGPPPSGNSRLAGRERQLPMHKCGAVRVRTLKSIIMYDIDAQVFPNLLGETTLGSVWQVLIIPIPTTMPWTPCYMLRCLAEIIEFFRN